MVNRIYIGGIPTDTFTTESLHYDIKNTIDLRLKRVYLHSNAHLVSLANSSEGWLLDYFNDSEKRILCDGAGIQIAAKLTNQQVPEKIPYNTWIWIFASFLAKNNYSIYLLGGTQETIIKAAEALKKENQMLKIAGLCNGYFDKQYSADENIEVIDNINSSNANVLLVGFGMPLQERWVKDNYQRIAVNTIFTCGGAFDFISGNKPVAPLFLRKLNLEFVYRTILEPKRMLKRSTIGIFQFLTIIFRQKFFK